MLRSRGPSPSSRCQIRCSRRDTGFARVFDIKYPNLRISSTCYKCSIVRVGHKLDGEDVGFVPGGDGGRKGEGCGSGVGLVGMDVQMLII